MQGQASCLQQQPVALRRSLRNTMSVASCSCVVTIISLLSGSKVFWDQSQHLDHCVYQSVMARIYPYFLEETEVCSINTCCYSHICSVFTVFWSPIFQIDPTCVVHGPYLFIVLEKGVHFHLVVVFCYNDSTFLTSQVKVGKKPHLISGTIQKASSLSYIR